MSKPKEFTYGITIHSQVFSEQGRKNYDKINWNDDDKKSTETEQKKDK